MNWKDYKHFQIGQRSRLQSDSSEKQAILYGAARMHKNSIMGTICVYNWTDMMVDMGFDFKKNHDREISHARISNAWIKDWDSDILRTQNQENEQRLLHKYNNLRFPDDEENQIYIIAPESLDFKRPTGRNKQYCVVKQPLNWRDGNALDLLISIEINNDFMVLIKGVEQDPDLGVKIGHPSIDDDSEATDSDK